jgi:hypothetical protein
MPKMIVPPLSHETAYAHPILGGGLGPFAHAVLGDPVGPTMPKASMNAVRRIQRSPDNAPRAALITIALAYSRRPDLLPGATDNSLKQGPIT